MLLVWSAGADPAVIAYPTAREWRSGLNEDQSLSKLPLTDLIAIVICTLAWGTTWYAITWQLGSVDAIVSVAYRFALAAVLLFIWCAMRGEPTRLSASQHKAAFGVGLFTFAIDYAFIYWAEERVISAAVAVMFATMSTLFEGKKWGEAAIGGVALVILGQWLLLRTRKA